MLEFEVTESMLMDDLEASAVVLNGLKTMGCRLAIDDFGTGYSSLTYLKRFPGRYPQNRSQLHQGPAVRCKRRGADHRNHCHWPQPLASS